MTDTTNDFSEDNQWLLVDTVEPVDGASKQVQSGSENPAEGTWIGIDLGTSNCTASIWDSTRGHPKWMRLGCRPGLTQAKDDSSKPLRVVPSAVLFAHRKLAKEAGWPFEEIPSSILPENAESFGNNIVAIVGFTAMSIFDASFGEQGGTRKGILAQFDSSDISNALVTSVKRILSASADPDSEEELLSSTSSENPSSSLVPLLDIQKLDPTKNENNEGMELVVSIRVLGGLKYGKTEIELKVTPLQVLAILLRSIRLASEDYLGRSMKRKNLQIPCYSPTANDVQVAHAVVGVPAHFGPLPRQWIVDCAKDAGFTGQVTTLTESTAAAMAYGLFVANPDTFKSILVLDMGGGTTDITIAEMGLQQARTKQQESSSLDDKELQGFRVRATGGSSQVGGDEMDWAILRRACDKLVKQSSSLASEKALESLSRTERRTALRSCRRGKELLCGDVDHGLRQPYNSVKIKVGTDEIDFDQSDLEISLQPILSKLKESIDQSLEKYSNTKKIARDEVVIHEVILVGGGTRVPAVRTLLREMFPPPIPKELCYSVNAMAAVSQGAAVKAAINSESIPLHKVRSAMMLDFVPHAIGILVESTGVFVQVIEKGASLPAHGSAVFQLAKVDQNGITVHAVEKINENLENDDEFEDLGIFNFLLCRLPSTRLEQLKGCRSVEVHMTLEESGQLIVSFFDENDPEHVRRRRQKLQTNSTGGSAAEDTHELNYEPLEQPTTSEQLFLYGFCIFSAILYIALKLFFGADRNFEAEL